jgi:FAD dependent oxidoreductase TIGR03364
MAHILIVGAGIFGTMHSLLALKQGHRVTLLERDRHPASASVRNFGMIAVGGRASGEELDHALRARELWGQIASAHPGLTLRPSGSIVVATSDQVLSVMAGIAKYPDAERRGWELMDANQVREANPGIQGDITGGLYCSQDAVVEPELVLSELRAICEEFEGFSYKPGQEILSVDEVGGSAIAASRFGERFEADYCIVVPGADHSTLFPEVLKAAPLRKVFLQMARLETPGVTLTTSIANSDSLRFYPGYQGPPLEDMPPVNPIVTEMTMQLLLQQRIDGTLTIGDTHLYEEPFPHEMREDAYQYLFDEASAIIGRPAPKVLTRWSGIYSQNTVGAVCVRERISKRVMLVTGPGGRGNTLSPAIAETSLKELLDV